MKISTGIIACAIAVSLYQTSSAIDETERKPRQRYLVLDDRIIEATHNAVLTVGTVTKHPSNPLFIEDKPWEKRFDNLYGNVIFNEEKNIYQCWYSPFIEIMLEPAMYKPTGQSSTVISLFVLSPV